MKHWLYVLTLECLFMHICHLSLVHKRRCAFQVKHEKVNGFSAAGNVSGSAQLCEKTECCLAIYKIINGELKVDTLACSKVQTVCPHATCKPSSFRNRFITCRCRTDFCNRNISWISEPEEFPETHFYAPGNTVRTLLVGILFLTVFIFIVAKWTRLCKEKKKYMQSSCNDYKVQKQCSCQTKASENQLTDIELQGVLGWGQFGTVYKGMHKGSVVAVKVYTAYRKHQFVKEKEVYELPLMKHEGIAQFLGTGKKPDDGSLLILLQYAEYGSLHSYLGKYASSWMKSMKLCHTLSEGVSYLHSDLCSNGVHKPPVAHRDLSSSNILVRADGTCVVCDFGSSTILHSCSGQNHSTNTKNHPQFCTLNYMSPEILEGHVNLSSFLLQGDIYALSLILWEIWMRCTDLFPGGAVPEHLLPYELELEANVTLERLIVYVSEMNCRPFIPESWEVLRQGPGLKELLTECWDHDTDARLTAPRVVERLISL